MQDKPSPTLRTEDYNIGWARATYNYFNQFPVPSYPKSSVPVKAINHERTVCAGGQINRPYATTVVAGALIYRLFLQCSF